MRAAAETVFVSRRFAVVGMISSVRRQSRDGDSFLTTVRRSCGATQVQGFVAMIIRQGEVHSGVEQKQECNPSEERVFYCLANA